MGKKKRKTWKVVPLCLFWTIWKERNRRAFKDKGYSLQGLKQMFLYNLWDWCNVFINSRTNIVVDFVDWIGAP